MYINTYMYLFLFITWLFTYYYTTALFILLILTWLYDYFYPYVTNSGLDVYPVDSNKITSRTEDIRFSKIHKQARERARKRLVSIIYKTSLTLVYPLLNTSRLTHLPLRKQEACSDLTVRASILQTNYNSHLMFLGL